LLAAAEELFGRYGYEPHKHRRYRPPSIGIGKGSIYLDFRTKDDILFSRSIETR
jgi:AcrR family transcriptional regulator